MIKHLNITGSDKRVMTADVHLAASPVTGLVIFVHGFKGFKDWGTHNLVADYFAQAGLNFLKFNFSHNGVTPGSPQDFTDLAAFGRNTFSKELFDLEQIVNFAVSGEAFAIPTEIYLLGHSRGGGISIITAAQDKRIDKLVTWASIADFRHLWKTSQEQEWEEKGVIYSHNSRTGQDMPLYSSLLHDLQQNEQKLSITESATNLKIPWLIVNGDEDASVSQAQAELLHSKNQASKLEIIQGGDHVLGAKHPYTENALPILLKEACDKTISFLKND